VAGVLERIAEMFGKIATDIGAEAVAAPMRIVAEVAQFAVLLTIVYVVAVGFGKRKGFVANMLTERRDSVAARIEAASHVDEVVAQAKHECSEIENAAHAETDADCSRIQERAESALTTEQQEMMLELREQLVELVSSATRAIMNEKLTISEQRTRIENTIVGSMSMSANHDAATAVMAGQSAAKGA
jgi:F0F1-type ATP synthase membrane subunit b/b'